MDHEQAFLQAIREEPDDDAHRLIYADWLEEQGGAAQAARAAFIRAQCRLAALPADEPMRDDLEDEAAGLLAEHEDEWTEPLHDVAQDWQFSRGLIENITIRGEDFLTHAERLFAFAPIRSLHLLIRPNNIGHLAACPHLHGVETLDFHRCHLNDKSLQLLLASPYLARLTALDLTGNGITTAGMQALIHSSLFPRLERLDLSQNIGIGDKAVSLLAKASRAESLHTLSLAETAVTVVGLQELFRTSHLNRLAVLNIFGTAGTYPHFPAQMQMVAESKLLGQLRSLDLSWIIRSTGLLLLAGSPRAAQLRALYLRGIIAGSADAEALANSPHLANLTTLDLGRNNLGAEGARALAKSPHLVSLTHLDLSSNNLRDSGAKALAESSYLKRLIALDLSRNSIGGPGLKALAASSNLGQLKTLNLAGNFIGAGSLCALAESSSLNRLSQLDLSDAHLEGDSARTLAASANLARLTTLLLQKNQLGDAGAKALAQSPYLTRLTTLDLNANRIGKAGAEALAAAFSWRRMRRLDLRDNIFTDREEALLRARFGDAVLL